MKKDPFAEYFKQTEPNKREKSYAWHTAIGLQAVDGLKPSQYLVNTAVKNIEGEISLDEARILLNQYYEERPAKEPGNREEEADKVAVRIAQVLSEKAFTFSPSEYISIHKKLFFGIYNHAGKLRDYNITKNEWVLNGDTVLYGSAYNLRATLEYDFEVERAFSYKGLGIEEVIQHLAIFVSRLWQIHIFGEGNTRTTAVFFIKYLRMLGFDVTNDIFAKNAWYFRNALVRANYNNLKTGIHETTIYLEKFLRNLLLGEKNELHNRAMHISGRFNDQQEALEQKNKATIQDQKATIEGQKATIQDEKAMIRGLKAVIQQKLSESDETLTAKTCDHVIVLYKAFGQNEFFGRKLVEEVTGLRSTRAYELIRLLLDNDLIVPVTGHGKGKYRFRIDHAIF